MKLAADLGDGSVVESGLIQAGTIDSNVSARRNETWLKYVDMGDSRVFGS